MIKIGDVDEETYDLSVKNPNLPEEAPLRDPKEILKEMEFLIHKLMLFLNQLKTFYENDWEIKTLGDGFMKDSSNLSINKLKDDEEIILFIVQKVL